MAYSTPAETPSSPSEMPNPKVGFDDPTSKVFIAALKKHKIKEEHWDEYALFITYGATPGNVIISKS